MKSVGVGIQGLSEVSLCGAESLSSGRDKAQTLSVHRVKLPQTKGTEWWTMANWLYLELLRAPVVSATVAEKCSVDMKRMGVTIIKQ